MDKTMKERVKRRLFKFGRKNRICGYLAILMLVVCMFFFHVLSYMKGNGKRFAMLAMMFCLFTVYSSFSFPIFRVAGVADGIGRIDLALEKDVSLAREPDLNMEEVALGAEEIVGNLSAEEISRLPLSEAQMAALREEQGAKKDPQGTGKKKEEVRISELFSKDDWRLILVNKQHSVPDGYEVPLGKVKTLQGTLQCDERLLDDYDTMVAAAAKDGVNLKVCSPYRDLDLQKKLFEEKITYYMQRGASYIEAFQLSSRSVTVPGASEHQLGLALDIVSDKHIWLTEDFGDTAAGIWLAKNSYKYGFILRYPEEKEYITGIRYEPWHFRYVGIEAATVITERGITLEEFWEELSL